ncbi:MAG: M15 family metallopeptidase [Saprospiraceae bacterium]
MSAYYVLRIIIITFGGFLLPLDQDFGAQKPMNLYNNVDTVDSIPLTLITGRFDPAQHQDFEMIDTKYASKSGMYLQKDAYHAFITMYEAAKKDGITLKILSATRNFNDQKRIWENKWTGKTILSNGENAAKHYPRPADRAKKILEFSSMPGTSRHHWGTDIDLNALNNGWFETIHGKKVYQWLQLHASEFGYCQPYKAKSAYRPTGYEEEKWHWTYMPIAGRITTQIGRSFSDNQIVGFEGCETAKDIQIVATFMLGIDQSCKR